MTCDRCKLEFEPLPLQYTKTVENKQISYTYLQCQHCGQKYTVCYDDVETVLLKEEIKKLTKKIKTARTEIEHKIILGKINRRKKQLKNLMMLLQAQYSKHFVEE